MQAFVIDRVLGPHTCRCSALLCSMAITASTHMRSKLLCWNIQFSKLVGLVPVGTAELLRYRSTELEIGT